MPYTEKPGRDQSSFKPGQTVRVRSTGCKASVVEWDTNLKAFKVKLHDEPHNDVIVRKADQLTTVLLPFHDFLNKAVKFGVKYHRAATDWGELKGNGKAVDPDHALEKLDEYEDVFNERLRHKRRSSAATFFRPVPPGWTSFVDGDVTVYSNGQLSVTAGWRPNAAMVNRALTLMASEGMKIDSGAVFKYVIGQHDDVPPGFTVVTDRPELPVNVAAETRILVRRGCFMWAELTNVRSSTAAADDLEPDSNDLPDVQQRRSTTRVAASALPAPSSVEPNNLLVTAETMECQAVVEVMTSENYFAMSTKAMKVVTEFRRLVRNVYATSRKGSTALYQATKAAEMMIDKYEDARDDLQRRLHEQATLRNLPDREQLRLIRSSQRTIMTDGDLRVLVKSVVIIGSKLLLALQKGSVNSWANRPEGRRSTKMMTKLRLRWKEKSSPAKTYDTRDRVEIFNGSLSWPRALDSLLDFGKRSTWANNADTAIGHYPWCQRAALMLRRRGALLLSQVRAMVTSTYETINLAISDIDLVFRRYLPIIRVNRRGKILYLDVHNDDAVNDLLVCSALDEPSVVVIDAEPDKVKPTCDADDSTADGEGVSADNEGMAAGDEDDGAIVEDTTPAARGGEWWLSAHHQRHGSREYWRRAFKLGPRHMIDLTAPANGEEAESSKSDTDDEILELNSSYYKRHRPFDRRQRWPPPRNPAMFAANQGELMEQLELAEAEKSKTDDDMPPLEPHGIDGDDDDYHAKSFNELTDFISSDMVVDVGTGRPRLIARQQDADGLFAQAPDARSQTPTRPSPTRRGPRPLCERFPNMVTEARAFIDANGTKAQERRRNDTVTMSNGVSLRQLRDHILRKVPALKEQGLSVTTVHRLLVPPDRRNKNSAKRYRGVIKAKVPQNSNTRRHERKGDRNHICMSQMAFVMENAVDQQDIIELWSTDDKAKLKVSMDCPCVSRYHCTKSFFNIGDAPNKYDHDFPTAGYLLTPSGYKILEQEDWQRYTRYYDRGGRPHLPVCREGPTKIVLRACKYQQSNAMAHANDMYALYNERPKKKPVLLVYADGGPDWACDARKSLYYYGRLWAKTNLDVLSIGSGGGGYSAYNPIERSWAPVSKRLSNTYLSDRLPGESKAPINQSGLTSKDLETKEHRVFDSAMEHAAKLWNDNFTIAGHPVEATTIPCASEPVPFNDMTDFELWCRIAPTHLASNPKVAQRLRKLDKYSERAVKKMRRITDMMKYFTRHVDRRSEFIMFRKCSRETCTECAERGGRGEDAKPFYDFIERHDNYYTPQMDTSTPGSFKTFLQVRDAATDVNFKFVPNKMMDAEYGPRDFPYRCQHGCTFCFTSKADYRRHHSRAWCRRHPRKASNKRSRAASKDANKRRKTGPRFDCPHEGCEHVNMSKNKRAGHWKEYPHHKPKKKKKTRHRHLPRGRTAHPTTKTTTTTKTPDATTTTTTVTNVQTTTTTRTAGRTTTTRTRTSATATNDDDDDEGSSDDASTRPWDCGDDDDFSQIDDDDALEPDDLVGPTTFVDKDHVAVKKLLVDDGGVWRDCTVFQNKASRGFVIWFGGEEYEGLGGTYKFDDGVLKDDDGVVIDTKDLVWMRRTSTPDEDYCGTCAGVLRYGSAGAARRAARARRRSGLEDDTDTDTDWYEVTSTNAPDKLDRSEHFSVNKWAAACDKCNVDLEVGIMRVATAV